MRFPSCVLSTWSLLGGGGGWGEEQVGERRMHGLQSVNSGAAGGVWGWQTKSPLVTDQAHLFNCFLEGSYSDTVSMKSLR